MLVPTPDGSYALPSGAVAVMKPNEAVFEKEIEGLPSNRSMNDIPPELRCPLCKEVIQDAVLTSKCCFKSFCDKCIRSHIISKSTCACGANNVLADDLLPNKTVRETINRFLESNNSSAENAGSMLHVQDMESARPAQPKVPSPTLSAYSRGEEMTTQPAQFKAPAPTHSASSKGEQLPPIQKDEGLGMQELASEAKDAGAPPLSLSKGRDANNVDACDATFDSMPLKAAMPQGSAPLAEEEMQQKPSASEPGKKKKKKKARLPPNELQWRTPQDIGGENYMMPFPPPACDPYWGNMQFGMDGFMNPYGGTMPYMGYAPGPFDPMGGMLPQDYFGGPGYMMPGFPHQRDFPDFPVGSSLAPPIVSRAEFEARKADLRRRRDSEGRVERIGSRDPEYGRNVSNDDDISSMKSEHRMMSKGKSPDHHHRHYRHQDEKESSQERSHHHRADRESSLDRSRHHQVERESSLDRSHHYHHRSHYHHDEREVSPERGHHHRRHRRTESPLHDAEPVRHVKRKSDRHDLPPSRDLEPVRKRRAIEQEDTVKDNGEDTADKKQKASVFSRISFPGETGGYKKRKVPSAGSSNLSNGYKDQPVRYANGHLNEIKRSEKVMPALDHDSSDDDERHFKRRPARYEPPPLAPPIEWEEDVQPSRSSRERAHNKHRDR
ncbi:hypothetical protein AQUCO_01700479v1 [Aquilegia coerulea]|nr:hypothetical protein AQUCO_01700479v1 [Aquilegia coerulea]